MKTVNLELSKQLKEAGYPQGSHQFYWSKYYIERYGGDKEYELTAPIYNPRLQEEGNKPYGYIYNEEIQKEDFIASPTADEILDQISCTIHIIKYGDKDYGTLIVGHEQHKGENLADLLAQQWLYLKGRDFLK